MLLTTILLFLSIAKVATYDFAKESDAVICCAKIPNPDFRACSYAAIESDIMEGLAYFAAEGVDPLKPNDTMTEDIRSGIAEDIRLYLPFMIQMEKCTSKGKDTTQCCLDAGVTPKCAAAVCNGTYNLELFDKKDAVLGMKQVLDTAAYCADGDQVRNLVGCVIV